MDMTAEVNDATIALLIDDNNNGSTTYFLGERQDRMFVATSDSVTIESKSDPHKKVVFDKNRWAQFVALFAHVDKEAKELNRKTRPVAYRQHIGNGYYVCVNDGFMCVDVRKYFLPYGLQQGEEKPTKHGISIRLDEWLELLDLVPIIHQLFPTLMTATACYEQDDHLNQLGFLACTSCNPFRASPY